MPQAKLCESGRVLCQGTYDARGPPRPQAVAPEVQTGQTLALFQASRQLPRSIAASDVVRAQPEPPQRLPARHQHASQLRRPSNPNGIPAEVEPLQAFAVLQRRAERAHALFAHEIAGEVELADVDEALEGSCEPHGALAAHQLVPAQRENLPMRCNAASEPRVRTAGDIVFCSCWERGCGGVTMTTLLGLCLCLCSSRSRQHRNRKQRMAIP